MALLTLDEKLTGSLKARVRDKPPPSLVFSLSLSLFRSFSLPFAFALLPSLSIRVWFASRGAKPRTLPIGRIHRHQRFSFRGSFFYVDRDSFTVILLILDSSDFRAASIHHILFLSTQSFQMNFSLLTTSSLSARKKSIFSLLNLCVNDSFLTLDIDHASMIKKFFIISSFFVPFPFRWPRSL